jgi:site-specific DNA recombinase
VGKIPAKARVAIYARFSSDKQSDASIEDQVHRARVWLRAESLDPDAALVFSDYAVSGASMERPGVQMLLRAIERGEFDVIVAESPDRISRDVADAARFRKMLAHHRVQLQCLDGTRLSPAGKSDALLFGVRSLFAEQYIADLADKTLRGLEGRARAGKATGGVPYGYRIVHNSEGASIEIDADRAANVRRMFADYVRGVSFANIAARLNAEGVPPPRAHSRRTFDGWMDTAVRSMLINECYRGVWTFGRREWVKAPGTNRCVPRPREGGPLVRSERPELAIVDAQTWAAVQARFEPRSGIPRTARVNYPLSGVLRCAVCGGIMTCLGGKVRRYACAISRKRGTCPNRTTLRIDAAEEAFFTVTANRFLDVMPEIVELAAQRIAEWSRTAGDRGSSGRKELADLDKEASNLAGTIAAAGPLPAIVERLTMVERRRSALKAELQRLSYDAPVLPHPAEFAKRVASFKGLRTAPAALAREFAAKQLENGRVDCQPDSTGYRLSWAINAWSMLDSKNPGSVELPGYAVLVAGAGFEPTTFGL